MRKKYFALLLVAVLLFALTACAKTEVADPAEATDPAVVEEPAEAPVEEAVEPEVVSTSESDAYIDGIEIEKDDKGTGPVEITSRFGSINIPAGLDYQAYYVPTKGGDTDTIQIDFGKGNTNAGSIHISSTRMVSSLDEAVAECSRTNDFGTKDSIVGEEVTYNGMTFKNLIIQKPDGSDPISYLIGYYKTVDDTDGYVQVAANGKDSAYSIDMTDPLIVELMESLVLE